MAQGHFRNQVQQVNVTRRFGAPKVATVEAWYKVACAFMPQVPNLKKTDWRWASDPEVTIQYIRYDLVNSKGEKCQLVIDRLAPAIG
jgi:hypothetical protein